MTEIVQLYNTSPGQVIEILNKFNINYDPMNRVKVDDNIIKNIINDYTNGVTSTQLKITYNLPYQRIRKIIITNLGGLRDKKENYDKRYSKKFIKKLIKLYLKGDKNLVQMEETIGLGYAAIRKILIKNNIPIRPSCHCPKSNIRSISGQYKNLYFKSMNELSFIINYLEKKNIPFFSGENAQHAIKYYDSINLKFRNYFPDFITDKYIFEIKPKSFWYQQNILDKKYAALKIAKNKNLQYRLVDYPVNINSILNEYYKNNIIFTKIGNEKFHRIYKKYLIT